jgi:hypothetical protein
LQPVLCDGDACASIVLGWNADAHCLSVRNDSERYVRVTLRGWLFTVEITLRPGELRLVEATEIDQPLYAEYVP